MPRSPRKKSKTGIYHVMLRGINRQDIFEDEQDYRKMLLCLEGLVESRDEKGQLQLALCTIYAYCLMSNHIHLLVKEHDYNLSEIVKKIGVTYAYYFNKKYDRYGHLFQDRFKSEPVEDSAYFLTLLRYIHQNPLKAGLSDRVEDYQWSSWREYVGKTAGSLSGMCDVEHVFSRYDRTTLEELILQPLENDGGINERRNRPLFKQLKNKKMNAGTVPLFKTIINPCKILLSARLVLSLLRKQRLCLENELNQPIAQKQTWQKTR